MTTWSNRSFPLKARDATSVREILLGPYGVSGFVTAVSAFVSTLTRTTMTDALIAHSGTTVALMSNRTSLGGVMQLICGATISAARVTVSATTFNCFTIPAGYRVQDIFIDLREGMTACDAQIGTSVSVALFGTHDVSLSVGGRLRPTFTKLMLSVMDTSLAADTTIQALVSISGTTDPASGSFIVKAVIY